MCVLLLYSYLLIYLLRYYNALYESQSLLSVVTSLLDLESPSSQMKLAAASWKATHLTNDNNYLGVPWQISFCFLGDMTMCTSSVFVYMCAYVLIIACCILNPQHMHNA